MIQEGSAETKRNFCTKTFFFFTQRIYLYTDMQCVCVWGVKDY